MLKAYGKPVVSEFGTLRQLTQLSGAINAEDTFFSATSTPPGVIETGVGSVDDCNIPFLNPDNVANCPDTFPGGQFKQP